MKKYFKRIEWTTIKSTQFEELFGELPVGTFSKLRKLGVAKIEYLGKHYRVRF